MAETRIPIDVRELPAYRAVLTANKRLQDERDRLRAENAALRALLRAEETWLTSAAVRGADLPEVLEHRNKLRTALDQWP